MSLGGGIALIVVGAILALAINVQVGWLDLDALGGILVGAGLVVSTLGILNIRSARVDSNRPGTF